MKKCETFEDLQALGAEKIHERTHISRDKVELILTKSYGDIGKVQFMGFMSILEREYGIDLSDIRYEYTLFRNEHDKTLPQKESVILQPASNARKKWMIAGAVVIGALITGGYVVQNVVSNEPKEEVMTLSTVDVEALKEPVDENMTGMVESNETIESNATVAAAETNATQPPASEAVNAAKGLIIHPVYKVWIGMIDLATGEKQQKITGDPIEVDTSKNWLMVLGHGRIEIETPEGKNLLKDKNTVYFACENGQLKQLTKSEFVERNGGKNW